MATQTADTVANILQAVSDYRGESTADTSATRIRSLTRAEQQFANRRLWKVHLRRNITTTGDGTGDYTIGSASFPMKQKGLMELFVNGTTEDKRYKVVDYAQFQNLFNRDNSSQIAYEWYDQANDVWKVHINPVVATGITITYSYFYQPPKRTLSTDVVVCPDMMLMIRLTLADVYEGEDEDKFQVNLQLAENIFDELEGTDEMPAVDQLYQVGAIENSIKTQGIGGY